MARPQDATVKVHLELDSGDVESVEAVLLALDETIARLRETITRMVASMELAAQTLRTMEELLHVTAVIDEEDEGRDP